MANQKTDDIKKERQWAHKAMVAQKSKVYKKFLEFEKVTYDDGALKSRIKQLIAVGISVQINCESCMQWHIQRAKECGATYDELFESIEVGIEMGGGPATVSARYALRVMDELFN